MGDDIERLRRGDRVGPVHVPLPERVEREAEHAADVEAGVAPEERPPRAAIVGTILLAVVGCLPHLVAPTVAIMVALVGAPLAWSLHRVSTGRRKRAFVALAGLNLLVAAISATAALVWLQLGVVDWPVPD